MKSKLRKSNFAALTLLAFSYFLVGCASYNSIMSKKVRSLLGKDFESYTYFSYPTDNFGLITTYKPPPGSKKIMDSDFLCDTWNCLKVNPPPTDQADLMNINGFAAVGDHGGIITLTESENNTVGFEAILPEIAKALSMSGDLNKRTTKSIQISMGRVYPRKLRRFTYFDFIENLPEQDRLRKSFDNGDLTILVSDIVIDRLEVKISVDDALDGKIKSAINPDGAIGKTVGAGKVSFQVSSTSKGEYTFIATKPVILGYLAKHQPKAGEMKISDSTSWDDWDSKEVEINNPVALGD